MITTALMLATLGAAPMQDPVMPALEQLAVPGSASSSNATKGCGAYCAAIAGRRANGSSVDFEEAERAVDPDGDGMCTMAELCRGLGSLGVKSTPMQGDPVQLPDGLNILHVRSSQVATRPDHFIVSEQLDDGQYRFYVPPIGSGVEDGRRVLELWEGRFVHTSTVP